MIGLARYGRSPGQTIRDLAVTGFVRAAPEVRGRYLYTATPHRYTATASSLDVVSGAGQVIGKPASIGAAGRHFQSEYKPPPITLTLNS